MATWHVIYMNHAGERKEADVEVKQSGANPGQFYAQNLQLFGCGKNFYSPKWAVFGLINDHGVCISATCNDQQTN